MTALCYACIFRLCSGELLDVMARLPLVVRELTGVDMSKVLIMFVR